MEYKYDLLLLPDGFNDAIITPQPEQENYLDEIVPDQYKNEFTQFISGLDKKSFHLDGDRITLLQNGIREYVRSIERDQSLRIEIKNFNITIKEGENNNWDDQPITYAIVVSSYTDGANQLDYIEIKMDQDPDTDDFEAWRSMVCLYNKTNLNQYWMICDNNSHPRIETATFKYESSDGSGPDMFCAPSKFSAIFRDSCVGI